MKSVEEQLALIKRGADEILVEAELADKLRRGKPCVSRPASTRPRPTCIWAIPS